MGSKTYKLEIENEDYYNLEDELYQSDDIFLIYDLNREGSMNYEYKNLTLSGKYFTNLFEDVRYIDQKIEEFNNQLDLLTTYASESDKEEIEYRDSKIEDYKVDIEELQEERIELMKDWEELKSKYHIFDLYAYVHSGVSFSMSGSYPYNCQWDSSQCGLVFVSKVEIPDSNEAEKKAKNHVEYLNYLSSGEVYQIQLFEITKCECCNKKNKDVIGGLSMIVGSDSLKQEIEYLLQENKIEERDVINLKELKEEWYF